MKSEKLAHLCVMDAKELRIGNWVQDGSSPYARVTGIFSDEIILDIDDYWEADIENVNPIPLTEDWLVKFGFEIFDSPFGYRMENMAFYLLPESKGNEIEYSSYDFDKRANIHLTCKSVHQLQNLYFALTGKELELGGNT